jgi:choline dehydrogenase-like flavoprotein
MIERLDKLAESSLSADVCIAGAGPAGIVLALTLAELGISSVLLEAGLLDGAEDRDHEAYTGEIEGLRYPLAGSRLRYFGGSSNHWGGWCKPLDVIDYSRRDSAPLPSWPLTPGELAIHLENAAKWCELGEAGFDLHYLVDDPGADLLFDQGEEFRSRAFRFSPPTRFGQRYRAGIEKSSLIRCVYDATLVSLSARGDAVRQAVALSRRGSSIQVQADRFVLAMGGIENPRLMMHALNEGAITFGNESGLLGACFMDHFGFKPGKLAAGEGLRHYRHEQNGVDLMPVITLSEAFQAEQDLPSICLMITPDAPSDKAPPPYFDNPGILGAHAGTSGQYRLQMIVEPTAHPGSRLTLSDRKDAYGLPRIALDWQVLDRDFEDTERFLAHFQTGAGRLGLGRVQRARHFEGMERRHLGPGMHHMGTTRMSDSPEFGVVDPDCRVHGSANLYVAGSSVFPRVGYSNPTLTIVALADRLGQHLADGEA